MEYPQPAETAPDKAGEEVWVLTNVLAGQASVAGHVDKEDVFASVLLEGDVLLPIEGEGSVLEDGAAHIRIAVRLQQKTSAREWSKLQGSWDISMLKTRKGTKTTPSFGTRLELRSPNSLCQGMNDYGKTSRAGERHGNLEDYLMQSVPHSTCPFINICQALRESALAPVVVLLDRLMETGWLAVATVRASDEEGLN